MSARFDEPAHDAQFIPRDWMSPGTTAIAADIAWRKYRAENPFWTRVQHAAQIIKGQATNVGWMTPQGVNANSAPPPPIQLPPGSEPGMIARASNAINYALMNDNRAFFPPGYPLQPQAPPEAKPRRWDYPFWWNLQIPPRAYESISFALLRHMADAYDLLRLVIETCKNRISYLEWDVVPAEKDTDKTKTKSVGAGTKDRIQWFENFMRYPDLKHDFSTWARSVLEDMLVIDAMSLYVDRALDGGVRSLRQVNGADLSVKIDYHGETPDPPETAYQQIIKGLPAIDYMDEVDMFYMPFNRRIHKGYGYSPVEQILITINIALRRQLWQLSFYRDGANTPFILEAPPNWNRDQMDDFGTWFNNLFFDNPAQRWRAVIVPQGSKAIETNHDALKDEQDDWLASLICYAFGCDRSQLTKPMNRASAEHSGEQSDKESFLPFTLFFEAAINRIKDRSFGWTDIEFHYGGLETFLTPDKSKALSTLMNNCGAYTINEIRNMLGMDPLAGGDQCVLAANFQLIQIDEVNKLSDINDQKEEQRQASLQATQAQANNQEPNGAPASGSGGPGEGKKSQKPSGSGQRAQTGPPGKPVAKGFDVSASPIAGLQPYEPHAPRVTMMHPRGIKAHYKAGGKRPKKIIRRASFTLREPSDVRVGRLKEIIHRGLTSRAQAVAAEAVKRLRKFAKAGGPTGRPSRQVQRALVNQLLNEGWAAYPDEIKDVMQAAADDTSAELIASAGIVPTEEQWDYIDQYTTGLARDRAGELVGMKWDEDSESWIENPNAEWAITDDVRDEVTNLVAQAEEEEWSSDQLSNAIQDAGLFGEDRSDMIARTEIKRIDAMSANSTAKATGATKKKWLLSANHKEDDECDENADDDFIDIDDTFASGAEIPPEHPNCQCVVTFGWEGPESEESEE